MNLYFVSQIPRVIYDAYDSISHLRSTTYETCLNDKTIGKITQFMSIAFDLLGMYYCNKTYLPLYGLDFVFYPRS